MYGMQQMSKPQPNNGHTQVQSVIITAITLFALAGAILGFAVGAMNHHSSQQGPTQPIAQHPDKKPSPPAASTQTPTPTPTPTVTAQKLCSVPVSYSVLASGTYDVKLQAEGMVNGACTPLPANGITTRLALVQKKPEVNTAVLKDPTSLNSSTTITNEIPNSLVFDDTTPQVQTTQNGVSTWKVTLSPSLPKGNYVIVGIADWNGTYYNWSWGPFAKLN